MISPHALVVGGSVGGLLAANLLARAGWRVSIFERTHGDLGDRGAAVGTTAELLRVMQRIDPGIDESIGVETRSRICLDRNGTVTHEVAIRGMTSAWSRLYRPLRAALPPGCYHAGAEFRRFEQGAGSLIAQFADDTYATGDLLIGADGLHSTVRRQLLPDVTPRYAGYVVWRAVLGEGDIPPDLRERIFHHMTFCFPDGEMVLCLPMAAAQAGGERRFQFAWFRPAEETKLKDLCTDASGRQHGLAIPPPLLRRELIEALKADARATLAPEIAALLMNAPEPILQPVFDCEAPRIASGRVALVGDAAFVARPHVATGITKAALDAAALADALACGDIDLALARYDAERRPAGSRLVARGRYLGAHLEAGHGDRSARNPAQILHEYGAAGVIDERAPAAPA
jgi:2-polyprenyl-6-methoxyphenol hydroxylase-like FAD-dependent oxidoreductase